MEDDFHLDLTRRLGEDHGYELLATCNDDLEDEELTTATIVLGWLDTIDYDDENDPYMFLLHTNTRVPVHNIIMNTTPKHSWTKVGICAVRNGKNSYSCSRLAIFFHAQTWRTWWSRYRTVPDCTFLTEMLDFEYVNSRSYKHATDVTFPCPSDAKKWIAYREAVGLPYMFMKEEHLVPMFADPDDGRKVVCFNRMTEHVMSVMDEVQIPTARGALPS
jgi:hypothetical protein